jgi:NAD(P)-dependent dehydrogenase (short-subunit alcohol dehydrogenase family)
MMCFSEVPAEETMAQSGSGQTQSGSEKTLSGSGKWTEADVPDQHGRTVVITGANSGIGLAAAKVLAARGAAVVLAGRDPGRTAAAAEQVSAAAAGAPAETADLDLASLDSVRRAAADISARFPRIDLLINNAGVMMPPYGLTKDGFELQFGTNHLGHFAFTGLLLDRLLPVAGSRVVTVSSIGHRIRAAIHFDDLQWERSYSRVGAYGQSKLANLLFTYELQRRLAHRGTTIAVAAHPGGSQTELTRNLPALVAPVVSVLEPLIAQDAAAGALPTLRAATDPGVLGGQYFGPDGFAETRGYPRVVASSDTSHDVELQRRLWAVSEELTGVVYPVD